MAYARRPKVWVWTKALGVEEKAAIAIRCEAFIAQTLIPRFLPEICPSQFNYPVAIFGKWRGRKYHFMTRYRSGFVENLGDEFEIAHSRIDYIEEKIDQTVFDIMWRRHTGQWWRLHGTKTLDEALRLIAEEKLLWPL